MWGSCLALVVQRLFREKCAGAKGPGSDCPGEGEIHGGPIVQGELFRDNCPWGKIRDGGYFTRSNCPWGNFSERKCVDTLKIRTRFNMLDVFLLTK